MATEIKRTDWGRFCKKFNTSNQFRPMRLTISETSHDPNWQAPFLGITLNVKGKSIDGVSIFAGNGNSEQIGAPMLVISNPAKILLEKDGDDHDSILTIRCKDGRTVRLELQGEKNPYLEGELVRQAAYSLYERRGKSHGNDWNDWFEAERRLRDLEEQLV